MLQKKPQKCYNALTDVLTDAKYIISHFINLPTNANWNAKSSAAGAGAVTRVSDVLNGGRLYLI